MTRSTLVLAALCLLLGSATARSQAIAPPDFATKYAIAEKNIEMEAGATYDRELGLAIERQPDFGPKFDACMRDNPGAQSLKGYFEFDTPTTYRLVLEPRGKFADCLARALEGRKLPPPPRVPYQNPFTFTVGPPAT